mgnify:CR=1 FL=1
MANVVIVVDMLVGFLDPSRPLYCGPTATAIVPRLRQLIEEELSKGSHIIYLVDTHTPDDKEFQMFPPHCIAGTEESELIPELRGYPGEIIRKTRYSGFYSTNLEARLRGLKPDKIIVMGVCTDICVMHTVADARNRDYVVEVPRDTIATFDQEAHAWALKHMEKILGARIV